MDKIIIKELTVDAIVGILPHEREYEQPLLLDLTLEVPLKACAQSGDLSLSINYADVCQKVTEFVRQQKARLLETLAEDLCCFILETYHPQTVTLRICKTQAVLHTKAVGVEITRCSDDYA